MYNANAVAGKCYQLNLKSLDHSLTQIVTTEKSAVS
ncbi:DUF1852 family protein [Vibrio lentus]|nr:DUF1852 family protein [Vibrio lentus]